MSWFIFALGTVFFWGFGQIAIKKGLNTLSPLWSNIIGGLLIAALYIPVALLSRENLILTPSNFLVILLGAILYILYYYAIEKGEIAVTGTIIAMYPVTTILLSVIFLHEKLTLLQIAMIVLILIGGFLLSQGDTKQKITKKIWIIWAIMGALSIGSADFLAKVMIHQTNASSYNFLFPFATCFALIFYWMFDKKGRTLPKNITLRHFLPTVIGVILMNFGLLSLNYAFANGPASLVSTVSSSYIGLTVLLAFFFLKESLTKKQTIAILMMLTGILLINI